MESPPRQTDTLDEDALLQKAAKVGMELLRESFAPDLGDDPDAVRRWLETTLQIVRADGHLYTTGMLTDASCVSDRATKTVPRLRGLRRCWRRSWKSRHLQKRRRPFPASGD
jgi:hypothetical protein